MTIEELAALLLAGGIGALGRTVVEAFKERSSAKRDDRRQKVEQDSSLVSGAKTLADASSTIVKLQDDQIDDLKRLIEEQRRGLQLRIDAQGAALAAYETRLDREMENRRKLQAELSATTDRLEREMVAHASTKARVNELTQTIVNLQAIEERGRELAEINTGLEQKVFDLSKGVMKLSAQLREVNLEPAYKLEVPVVE